MTAGLVERDFCTQKLNSVIGAINRLLAGDYPHKDSFAALTKILEVYEQDKALIANISSSAKLDTVLAHCLQINVRIVNLKTFLGLLIRSSNLRNAFEIYFPIKVLATELLERDVAVVLSSEWDFSPYVYPVAPDELKDFIFIGIPASECQNPLIIPLAGHELGHVVWRERGVFQELRPIIRRKVLELYKNDWSTFKNVFGNFDASTLESNLFLIPIWGESLRLAESHLEELFCDFLGVYLFGQSFLHSFRYLVAPSLGEERSIYYPPIELRARCMQFAAKQYKAPEVRAFSNSFSEEEPNLPPPDKFMLDIADEATNALYPSLIDLVKKHKGKAKPFNDGADLEKRAADSIKKLVPVASLNSVAAIINAGWAIRLDLDNWDILPQSTNLVRRSEEKIRVLRDLVLKSLEVFEYRKRLERHATKR